MRKCKFNDEQIVFLQKNAEKHPFVKDLTEVLNLYFGTSFPVKDVKYYLKAHEINLLNSKRYYNKEEIEFLREKLLICSRKKTLELFNQLYEPITMAQLKRCMKKYELFTERSGQFEKEHELNQLPIGSEKIWSVKGKNYIGIKVAQPSQWMYKHIYLWEQTYGKVPEGKVVIFLDGNSLKCTLDNLMCIDKRINCIMNKKKLKRTTKEETLTSINIATLIAAIKEAEKRIKKHKETVPLQ